MECSTGKGIGSAQEEEEIAESGRRGLQSLIAGTFQIKNMLIKIRKLLCQGCGCNFVVTNGYPRMIQEAAGTLQKPENQQN